MARLSPSQDSSDWRADVAKYYDLNPDAPKDINFYRGLIPSAEARILELGCGTGRVLVPLALACGYIHGIDNSDAMVALCRQKLKAADIPENKAHAEIADITNLALNEKFDLITAPYRVLQLLESDTAVEGLIAGIRDHLAPGGSSVLNVFRPYADADTLRRQWCAGQEKLRWEVPVDGGRVTCHERRPRMDRDRMVLYPELIYRQYQDEVLVDEATLRIAMRCYYPEQFLKLVVDHGFRVLRQWGGYSGETYGEGPELVIQFLCQ